MVECNLKCVTLNCRGLRDKGKRLSVFQYLKDENVDVACLQETYVTDNFICMFNKDWPGQIFHAYSDSTHSRGVAILLKKTLNSTLIDTHRSEDGRRIMINLNINDEEFCFISAYAPDKNRIEFLKKLSSWISKYACNTDRVIIGADLNTVDNVDDRSSKNLDYSSSQFTKFKQTLNLIDVWRDLNNGEIEYTYLHPSVLSSSRIDYILCSTRLASFVKSSFVNVAPVPDHKAVHVKKFNE